jgi:hypothetical protein
LKCRSIAFYGTEAWELGEIDQKYCEFLEIRVYEMYSEDQLDPSCEK